MGIVAIIEQNAGVVKTALRNYGSHDARRVLALLEEREEAPGRNEMARRRIDFIREHPAMDAGRLCDEMKRTGLYSNTTAKTDVMRFIRKQREARP